MYKQEIKRDESTSGPQVAPPFYSNIDYSDVNFKNFKSKRVTNPIDPIYDTSNGLIEKSKPKIFINAKDKVVNGQVQRVNPILRSDDIVGANAGSALVGNFRDRERKDFPDPMNIGDIKGAQPNTLNAFYNLNISADKLNASRKKSTEKSKNDGGVWEPKKKLTRGGGDTASMPQMKIYQYDFPTNGRMAEQPSGTMSHTGVRQ